MCEGESISSKESDTADVWNACKGGGPGKIIVFDQNFLDLVDLTTDTVWLSRVLFCPEWTIGERKRRT